MSRVFAARIELGQVQESDALDEMFRQIQKKHNEEILIGHPDLHRVLKELVKLDAETKDTKLDFTSQLASVMLKNLDECLKTRAAWVFVEILEHDNTKHLVAAELKENAGAIQKLLKSKDLKGTMGLQRIQKHIS